MKKRTKKKRNNPFGSKDLKETVGNAYQEKVLLEHDDPDFIYDEVDKYHREEEQKEIKLVDDKLYARKAKKQTVLSLGLDSSDSEEDDPKSKTVYSSSSEEEEEEKEHLLNENGEFEADEDIIGTRKHKEFDDRAWGKESSVYFGTDDTDHTRRKQANLRHLDEAHEAAEMQKEDLDLLQSRVQEKISRVQMDLFSAPTTKGPSQKDEEVTRAKPVSSEDAETIFHMRHPELGEYLKEVIGLLKEWKILFEPTLYKDRILKQEYNDIYNYVVSKYKIITNYQMYFNQYGLILTESPEETKKPRDC